MSEEKYWNIWFTKKKDIIRLEPREGNLSIFLDKHLVDDLIKDLQLARDEMVDPDSINSG